MINTQNPRHPEPGGLAIPDSGNGHGNGGAGGAKNLLGGACCQTKNYLALATYNLRTMRTYEKLYELEEALSTLNWDILGLSEVIIYVIFWTLAAMSPTISRMWPPTHVSRVRRLYKLILRVHRALPTELRIMGDNYARDEFNRHKSCNPEEARIFLNEWTDYAITLAKQMKPLQQAKRKVVGTYLDPLLLDHMSDEQIVQLYELHRAATGDETITEHTEENK